MTPTAVVDDFTLTLFDPDQETAGEPTDGETASTPAVATVEKALLPPAAASERVAHNLTVIRLLHELRERRAGLSDSEREVLMRWAGWGAVPELFDADVARYSAQREDLLRLVGPDGYAAARRSTINAHYTHPLIADAMWRLAERLGFPGGRVLEPGCGPGVFLARAPEGLSLTAVEIDPTTAAIAQTLYPHAAICTSSFAEVRGLADGTFDLVIGNVPFGDVVLYDPVHNKGKHSIHNHFLIKSLMLLRACGLLVALTSRYTLDSQNDRARIEMHELGELLAAVRLPAGAHRRVAGTDALTDLLVLRRRDGASVKEIAPWVTSAPVQIDGEEALLNRYFVEHPERIAGSLTFGDGPYTRQLSVEGDISAETVSETILAVTETLAPAATANSQPAQATEPVTAATPPPVDLGEQWDGHIITLPDGGFAEVIDGKAERLPVPKNAIREMRLLLTLRDKAGTLLAEEAAHVAEPAHLERLRGELRSTYQRYLRTYGPINRYKTHGTGRTDPETDEPIARRSYPRAVRLLMGDPLGPLVISLEVFDEDTQTANEADLLRQRVLHSRESVTEAQTPEDALAICWDRVGKVDLELIASLLSRAPEQARGALGELVYEDPDKGGLVPAAEYLSGNVRVKLDRAREAAATDSRFDVNVAALTEVQPVPLGADEIAAKMGAVWISDTVHQRFLRELLQDDSILVQYGGGNIWVVKSGNRGTLAESEWGTRRMPAPEIAAALLEQKPVVARDRIPDTERYVVNADETTAAQEKATAMQERFAEWCWEDPQRASELVREYNDRFNSLVLRDYGPLGQALTLPGLTDTFTAHDHQRAAVARIISEPSVGLFHQVGAGKTASMVIAAHELRRLGLAQKAAVVVPNHMLGQFAREWLQLYPMAKILAAGTDDLTKDKRRRFVARAAANEWDAIIMTRSAFERLGVSPEVQKAYLQRELADIRDMLDQQRARDAHLTIKRLEKKVMRAEAAMQKRLDGVVDLGVTWEQTGIDYLFVDEAHGYKNLATVSNIPGAGIVGSNRAEDLYMKLEHLRVTGNERVATFATATPIANSITEAHVMCRYLRPDLLEDAGIRHFDAWAATFAETVTQMEMAVTGGGHYRLKTRFARFQNVPEMLRVLHLLADVKTAEDLKLPTPPLKPRSDGQCLPETVVIPTPPEVKEYLQHLAERAEKVKDRLVRPEEDNMLKISTDGRKAALDMRLVGERKPIKGRCKLQVVADNVARIHHITRKIAYRVPRTDVRHPTLGSLQIVFCDLSTPDPRQWNAYHELRRLLIERGLSAEEVRFIHEAKSDTEKARLFEACRSGQVAVLIGSTEKMGVGTNIQARAIALHHVDCPWRPADIEQREGRILRQGNQHSSGVRIYRYVVEGSFDAYSWQTVERKALFIGQIMRGRFDVRAIEEIADNALSFAEVKALAAGDTLILDQATLSAEVTRLQRLQRAHRNNQAALKLTVENHTAWLATLDKEIAAMEDAIARHVDTRGEKFAITIDGTVHTNRANAGIALTHLLDGRDDETRPIGALAGFAISGCVRYSVADDVREARLMFDGLPINTAYATLTEAHEDPLKLIRQLESRVNSLDALRAKTVAGSASVRAEGERAQAAIGTSFKYADALAEASAKLEAVNAELQAKAVAQERPSEGGGEQDSSTEAVAVPVGATASDDIPI
jgi:N12 class adenine-specific DNA methylase/SAM-dependent methyltransferase